MRVRRLLPLGIGAVAGTTRDEVGGLAQFAIFKNRKDCNTVADIIGDQHMPAGLVDDDVAGSGTARSHLIQQCEPSGWTIHGKRAHRSTSPTVVVVEFVDRIQKSA